MITKFFLDGTVQQHDFKTEQASIVTPYETPFFEFEVDRKIEQFGNIAHVWSEFEMKPNPKAMPTAVDLIVSRSCFWMVAGGFRRGRHITRRQQPIPQELPPAQLVDLDTDEFAEVVKSIVQDTLQACEVQGGMEGRAKMNLAVVGEVKAKLVCETD